MPIITTLVTARSPGPNPRRERKANSACHS